MILLSLKKWSRVGPECDWGEEKAFQAEKSMTKDTIVKQPGIFKKVSKKFLLL